MIPLSNSAPSSDGADSESHGQALDATGFWGRVAAGSVVLAEDTGRVLLDLRSESVLEPGTWGTWGGAVDSGETPLQAALRELIEECGYKGLFEFIKLTVFRHESGFAYHNHLAIVPHEFVPLPGSESAGFGWFKIDDLPDQLHPGLEYLLEHSGRVIRDIIAARGPQSRPEEPDIDLISFEQFLTGPGRTFETLDIDDIFGKDFGTVRDDALHDNPQAFDAVGEGRQLLESPKTAGYWLQEVEGGVALYGPSDELVGGYIGCDLALKPAHRGRGLGAEIVKAYYQIHESLPTWHLDVPAYSTAGLRCHEAAWRRLQEEMRAQATNELRMPRMRR
jgi:8-oxo-dGTP pyrophosphatase MutT (NUDIX family)/GNAT superfamily N-acetyltransferase